MSGNTSINSIKGTAPTSAYFNDTYLYWWVDWSTDSAMVQDPSLYPYTPRIKQSATNFADDTGYSFYMQKLYTLYKTEVTLDEDGFIKFYMPKMSKLHWLGGTINQGFVRPDGKDSQFDVVNNYVPRVKGLDFNTSNLNHKGELQDRQAYEILTATDPYKTGDKALCYYDIIKAGTTLKKYSWVDGNGQQSGHNQCAGSLRIQNDFMQIWDFFECPKIDIASFYELSNYGVLAHSTGKPNDPTANVKYLNLANLGDEISVVTNVSFDTGTGQFVQTKTTVKLISIGGAANSVITTAEPCPV
jgi:hypothetical protein